jgi:exopolysaccharide biosynthesis polyprenyl glycosylphosphotransferase
VFAQQLCLVIGGAFLLQALLLYAKLADSAMPRQAMLIGSVACFILAPMWRSAYGKLSIRVLGAEKVIFIGTHQLQYKLAEYLLANPEFAMEPAGFLTERPGNEPFPPPAPVLGDLSCLPGCLKGKRVDRVVIGFSHDDPALVQFLQRLAPSGYRTDSMGDIYELVFGRVAIAQMQPMQIVFKKWLVSSHLMLKVQAIYSWVIAFIALVLLSPIMLATALAVRLSSPGPILFRQVRTGRNNVPFVLYKFRSMDVDAEARTGAIWAQENDPRVTAVGRVIRKYRLDELPQLFNVLRNEMALVGPRPERPEFVNVLAEQIPFYNHRHSVKPGITGWAQVNYHYGNTVEDTIVKLEYDLYYIKNFAPQLDFYVMFHTAKTMLLTRGAY